MARRGSKALSGIALLTVQCIILVFPAGRKAFACDGNSGEEMFMACSIPQNARSGKPNVRLTAGPQSSPAGGRLVRFRPARRGQLAAVIVAVAGVVNRRPILRVRRARRVGEAEA